MAQLLEKQIDEFFNKPIDGKKLFGSVCLNQDVFFDAIKHFAGAKAVKWGPPLARDGRTEGEIHKYLIVDKAFYEYSGNYYERDSAKAFVKGLVKKTVKPYEY